MNCTHTHTHKKKKQGGKVKSFLEQGNSGGISAEITIIFQHAELCASVHARVCVCGRADRLLADSLVIQGCFHVAVCVGDEEEVALNT